MMGNHDVGAETEILSVRLNATSLKDVGKQVQIDPSKNYNLKGKLINYDDSLCSRHFISDTAYNVVT